MVTSIYSEHEWLPWKFTGTPKNFWKDVNNVTKFLDWAGKNLGVKQYEDWYKIMTKVEISMNFPRIF